MCIKFLLHVCVCVIFVYWITGSKGEQNNKMWASKQKGYSGRHLLFEIYAVLLGVFISNLSEACYRCLCHVSTKCDVSHGCTGGYCGPFNISRVYWVDAGRVILPEDDVERNHAWEDCARNYYCAKQIIEGYLTRFGKDCNGDGVTDCYDYMMVNGNGGYGCTLPLNRSVNGRRWLVRYEECRQLIL